MTDLSHLSFAEVAELAPKHTPGECSRPGCRRQFAVTPHWENGRAARCVNSPGTGRHGGVDVGKRKAYNIGGPCPMCGRVIDDYDLIATGPARLHDEPVMCDPCAELLRDVNGFSRQPRRKHEPFYDQQHLTEGEIEVRVRGYQLTVAGYRRLLEDQRHRCAICSYRPQRSAELVIDHNHKTGMVRGLLCAKCNTALGLFRDSPDVLDAAIEYLEQRGCYGLDTLNQETA